VSIKVLCIENDDSCILEVSDVLQKEPETFEIDVCNTLKEGLIKLEYCNEYDDPIYNVILLDLSLPNGEGFSIFNQVISQCKRIPVVVISEYEEKALECIKAGAQDYIIKPDHIFILPKSLRYAIERFRIDQRYHQLVETTHASIYEIDIINQKFTYVNSKTCEYTGYSRQELLRLNPFHLLTIESGNLFKEKIEKLNKGEVINNTEEFQFVKKNGEKRWALVTTNYIISKNMVIAARVVAVDITDRKRRLKLIENIFESSPVALGILGYEGGKRTLVQVNNFMCKMLGYKQDELQNKSARILYPTQDEFDRIGKYKYEIISKGKNSIVETQWVKKDNEILDIMLTTAPLDISDPYGLSTFTALDITEEKTKIRELNLELDYRIEEWRDETRLKVLEDGQITALNQIIAGIK